MSEPMALLDHQSLYILDTHTWVWQLFNPQKLSKTVHAVLEAADLNQTQILIPAVVLAEMSMIAQKQRVQGFQPQHLAVLVATVHAHPAYSFGTLDVDLILHSQRFTAIPDVFDRLIATEAATLGATLLTRDPVIIDSGLVQTLW